MKLGALSYQLPALLWAVFIFVLCGSTTGGFSSMKLFDLIPTDKLGHFVIFAVFVFFIIQGLMKHFRFPFLQNRAKILAVITGIIYGGFVEAFQYYSEMGRQAEWWDFMADVLGSLTGIVLFYSVYGNLNFLKETKNSVADRGY